MEKSAKPSEIRAAVPAEWQPEAVFGGNFGEISLEVSCGSDDLVLQIRFFEQLSKLYTDTAFVNAGHRSAGFAQCDLGSDTGYYRDLNGCSAE